MKPIKSSNLHACDTDGDDLLVQFKGKDGPGKTYRYAGGARHQIPLMASPSPGSYLHSVVKGSCACNCEPEPEEGE